MLVNMPTVSLLDVALLCHPIIALVPSLSTKSQPGASRKQYLALSFFALLAFRYHTASTPPTTPLLMIPSDMALCQTHDLPNPIAHLYPGNATGTLNGTISVLPIPLTLARQLIPAQYTILTSAYQSLLPSFPPDMYPAILQAVHDHEVQAFGYKIPDFTRTGIEFPFVDMFSDGTSFKWNPSLLMSAGHEIALKGARDYGIDTLAAVFEPACDAYVSGAKPGETVFSATSESGTARIETVFEASSATAEWAYSLEFFKNVTNQPIFADGKTCDNMIRLFNTSVTTSIETVVGSVRAIMPPFSEERVWKGVEGIRLDSAFIENNYLPCESFRGYGAS
ncbi:uncharacterized protein M421DRAFT_333469 [Didymella exigua CBS 183.55]|uniref:Uncharacterized protein n=1 Tax=Didymella exigua CBS 183.55 TaxID=1150837 RepID=A0A6A5R5X0_9PLEO|nr:uncharacterized protein M421DRAFT_333469 [Didymella exigua CBS 183.55]KAF1922993.1 hypothetical protein M421DRAFT_333469 [Didymella exigua CBS 183.55]